jgi:hypothetical protein
VVPPITVKPVLAQGIGRHSGWMHIFRQEPHQPGNIRCRVRAAPNARPIRRLSRCLRFRESVGATVGCRPRLWVCGLAAEAMQGRGRWPWHETG